MSEKLIATTITGEVACPRCGKLLDSHTSLEGVEIPSIGDLTICSGCCSILEYGEGLSLKAMTGEQLMALAKEDPRAFMIIMPEQEKCRQAHKRMKN